MPEELNQVSESTDTTDELSIDEVTEPTSEEPEDDENSETEQTAEKTEDQKEDASDESKPSETDQPFEVTYNGEKQTLTKDEAIAYAQKGMNYDKMLKRLQTYENDPTRRIFAEQAERAGLSIEDYAEKLNQFQKESEIQRIATEYQSQHENVDDDAAREYAQMAYNQRLSQKQREQQSIDQQLNETRKQRLNEEVGAFMKEYPDVDLEHLPQDVIDSINAGQTLRSAYHAYENKQLKQQLAALQKNTENKKKSVGNLTDNAGDVSGRDAFETGLLG